MAAWLTGGYLKQQEIIAASGFSPTEIVRVNYPLPWAVAVIKLYAVAGRDRNMIFKRLLLIDRDSSVPLRETLRRNGDAGYGHARLLIRYQAG